MSGLPSPDHRSPGAGARWRGWPEIRADVRTSVRLVLVLGFAGIPAGLTWRALAPRADFRITDAGPQALGAPTDELLVADDVVFAAVLAVVGLLAGAAAWFLRRRRGVAVVVALAFGALAAAVVAWRVGELLAPAPTEGQVSAVGSVVTTSLTLGSPAALAVAPFTAVLAYVVAAIATDDDGLGRTAPSAAGPAAEAAEGAGPPAAAPVRPPIDIPPHGRPRA